MCQFIGNDTVMGNLFIRLIDAEKESIQFNEVYKFIYYASVNFNKKEKTRLLTSYYEIHNFVRSFSDYLSIDEEEKKITITIPKEKISNFKIELESCYVIDDFKESFDEAMSQLNVA